MKSKKRNILIAVLLIAITFSASFSSVILKEADAASKVSIRTSLKNNSSVYVGKSKDLGVETNTPCTMYSKVSDSKIGTVKYGIVYGYKPGKLKIRLTAKPLSKKYKESTKDIYIRVLPAKPSTPSATRTGTKISATTQKIKYATGYQFMYATNSKFDNSKTIKTKKLSASFSASSSKNYYIKVRSYTTVGQENYYSGWSKVKKVKAITAPSPTKAPENIPVSTIHIKHKGEKYDYMDMWLNEGPFTLTTQIYPSNATNKKVTWSSSDPSVATIDQDGNVKPLRAGQTKIVAQTNGPQAFLNLVIYDIDSMVERAVELTNIERVKGGLQPLKMHPSLQKGAMVRAEEISRKFEHIRPDGRNGNTALFEAGVGHAAGENIAAGFNTPESVVKGWMESQGHMWNIMESDHTHIGIGIYFDKGGCIYWVQAFANGDPDDYVTFSFDTMGGTPLPPIKIPYGGGIKLKDCPKPTKEGYEFSGWYRDSTLTGSPYTVGNGVTFDRTLYAKWIPIS